jgi:hypothetical protein
MGSNAEKLTMNAEFSWKEETLWLLELGSSGCLHNPELQGISGLHFI